jgi:hypothetical protein
MSPGGHGHAQEPCGDGVCPSRWPTAHRPGGVWEGAARWPVGVMSGVSGPQSVACAGSAAGTRPPGPRGGVGPVRGAGAHAGARGCSPRSGPFWVPAGATGPVCGLPAHPRPGVSHVPRTAARCRGSLPGVRRCAGPGWGRVSAPVGAGPVTRSGRRRVCGRGIGQVGAPEPVVQGVSPSGAWSPSRLEQAAASDVQKRPLRSRCWPRLSRSVRRQKGK